jgi:hypothetical protein
MKDFLDKTEAAPVDSERQEPKLTRTEQWQEEIIKDAGHQMRNEADCLGGDMVIDNSEKGKDKPRFGKFGKAVTMTMLGLTGWAAMAAVPTEAYGRRQSREVQRFNQQIGDSLERLVNGGKTFEQSNQIEREGERTIGIERKNVQQILDVIDRLPISAVDKVNMKRPYLDQLHGEENYIRTQRK